MHEEYSIRLERLVEDDKIEVSVRFGTFVSEEHSQSASTVLDRIVEILDQDEELRQWSEDVDELTLKPLDEAGE